MQKYALSYLCYTQFHIYHFFRISFFQEKSGDLLPLGSTSNINLITYKILSSCSLFLMSFWRGWRQRGKNLKNISVLQMTLRICYCQSRCMAYIPCPFFFFLFGVCITQSLSWYALLLWTKPAHFLQGITASSTWSECLPLFEDSQQYKYFIKPVLSLILSNSIYRNVFYCWLLVISGLSVRRLLERKFLRTMLCICKKRQMRKSRREMMKR